MSDNFYRLEAKLQRAHEDDFTQACFELGAAGVAEDLTYVQKDLRYDPDVVETPELNLNVFFLKAPSPAELDQLRARFPDATVTIISEENRDWMAEWKKGFKAFLFSNPFWVVPRWLEVPPDGPKNADHVLWVEPGMAFGTGTHETTRLAAGFIVEELTRKPAQSLLDVGTGTAILAIVARRLGVKRIVGLDNDPEARRTARENLELNKETTIEIPDDDVQGVTEKFDVVVANIIDGVLLVLANDLEKSLKPGGRMILSGILTDREREFFKEFTEKTGLKLVKQRSDGEWIGALLTKDT